MGNFRSKIVTILFVSTGAVIMGGLVVERANLREQGIEAVRDNMRAAVLVERTPGMRLPNCAICRCWTMCILPRE